MEPPKKKRKMDLEEIFDVESFLDSAVTNRLKEKLISKSKNTSIENKKLQGKVTNTFVKGVELFKL